MRGFEKTAPNGAEPHTDPLNSVKISYTLNLSTDTDSITIATFLVPKKLVWRGPNIFFGGGVQIIFFFFNFFDGLKSFFLKGVYQKFFLGGGFFLSFFQSQYLNRH